MNKVTGVRAFGQNTSHTARVPASGSYSTQQICKVATTTITKKHTQSLTNEAPKTVGKHSAILWVTALRSL